MNINTIMNVFKPLYFGFIKGHSYLERDQLNKLKSLIGNNNNYIVKKFENGFAGMIGTGECIAYAAGRMGFYDLMKYLDISDGDEVILPGSTCAVMANAVIKIGATPIYSDIDPNTFGSSPLAIEACITHNTKMVVAQHSFGIPCDIQKICNISKSNSIFLLEDCALTLGSSINGTVVGNFGDASLFSTDHSKPINTIIGGLIYTKNIELGSALRSSRDMYKNLPIKKQYALWRRLLIEKKFCNVKGYGNMGVIDFFYTLGKRLFNLTEPFLSNDSNSEISDNGYPYPAKMPSFLAQLGIYEVERWGLETNFRQMLFHDMLNIASECSVKEYLPESYLDSSIKIVPLRFVWSDPCGMQKRNILGNFIHTDWTWFMKPIIATREPLENFGYEYGRCPISEAVGKNMVNIPCNICHNENHLLLAKIKLVLSNN